MDIWSCWGYINAVALASVIWFINDGANLSFVNPIVIYTNIKVNWFGAICITIIVNTIFMPIAIIYWLYKICTVGRKDIKK